MGRLLVHEDKPVLAFQEKISPFNLTDDPEPTPDFDRSNSCRPGFLTVIFRARMVHQG